MATMLVAVAVCAAGLMLGAPNEAAVTIIGTPEGATVIEPGRAPQHYAPRDLRLLNQQRAQARPAPAAEAEAAPEPDRPPLPVAPAADPPLPPTEPEPEPSALTAEQLAAKEAAMRQIEVLRQYGGAYISAEDGRPVSQEELTQMLESGEMRNLHVVDLWQQRHVFDFEAIEQGEE